MEQLPDDVLVMAMQFLDVPDLLACRLVCKRLGVLALHRDAWRHRRLGDARRECVCPVLRLAPCLAVLRVSLPPARCPAEAFPASKCAVTELKISAQYDSGVYQAEALIRRQEQLGRLQRLDLSEMFADSETVFVLLENLAAMRGLESLALSILTKPPGIVSYSVPAPSLREFRCNLRADLATFVDSILAGHAATLRAVHLLPRVGRPIPNPRPLESRTAARLAALPNLCELSCDSLPGIEAVAACESLRELAIVVRTHEQQTAAAEGAAELFRRSGHLRRVELVYVDLDDAGADVVLAPALAACGRSGVETLVIKPWARPFPLRPLVSALPRLRALRHLQLDVQPAALLHAIRPATAPALRTVDLGALRSVCAHAWIHGKAVRAVMAANPALHIRFAPVKAYCARNSCASACVLRCHGQELRDLATPGAQVGLYSHDPDDRCSRTHATDCLWIRVPL
ncbi:uncharacterized protein LOC127749907 [Frankliniella occidentalis]|uniref:Uncharacterized protein LOC127749907 n=1 Tax=Frankliniella occidentalis TaxID=133901 RepID=A0A9C6U1Q3_FRAOC|nr:uncharacterized protein LOC127749907 [Frankliniella occidentalis]